jgi:hypothetical protein
VNHPLTQRILVNDKDMQNAVHSWMAEAQMRMIQNYVNRGRLLENIPEETLAEDWVSLMRAWAAAPEMGQDPRRRDIEAEYSLRGVQPPYALVKAEMDVLARRAAELIQQMDIVAGDEIDSMILDQSSDEKKRAS